MGRASPKLTLGRGVNPAVWAIGNDVRRSARSHIRATSRWLVESTFTPNDRARKVEQDVDGYRRRGFDRRTDFAPLFEQPDMGEKP